MSSIIAFRDRATCPKGLVFNRHLAIAFLFLLFTSSLVQGQVVNIEQARVNADSVGWNSSLDLSFFRQEFDDNLTTINGRFSAQHKDSKYYILYLADAGYSYSKEDVFTNFKLAHIRTSVKLLPRIRLEAFVQGQDNRPLGIQFRSLVGLGPRIKFIAKENGRAYGGTSVMLENEWSTNGTKNQWLVRSSNYLNVNWQKTDMYGWSSTIYYQPAFQNITDYRVSGQHSLVAALTKHVGAKIEFTHYFDSSPPSAGLNRSRVTTIGLSYQFT